MSPTTGAATGHCPVCGQPFTSTPRQRPRRRYCSERCRKTAWRHRHPGHRSRPRNVPPAVPRPGDVSPAVPRPGDVSPAVPRPGDVPPAVPRPGDVSPAVPRPGEILHASPARAEPAARCPHCARPVAVIALLVVPAAAQVPAPEVRDG
jgi:endogenous inhibitor of DNA gyrase (YacG/DUF329 family)